jgi:DNA (cytosine-5)-methyltransferase 1
VRLIDLFSGAGGLTLGFSRFSAGVFTPVWANDFNRFAVDTYNRNFGPHCLHADIVDLIDAAVPIPAAEVVIGGPPCQGFSLLNKNREGDPRKALWRPFFVVVERSGAQFFVMENVPQLLGSAEHELIVERAEELGFRVASGVLCAADYGVPQTRYRAFIVGSRVSDPVHHFPPKKTHYNPSDGWEERVRSGEYVVSPKPWATVGDAIADLPPPCGVELRREPPPFDLHFGRTPTPKSMARYRAVSEQGMNRFDLQRIAPELLPGCWLRKKTGGTDLFGRLWWKRPAFTIRTEFFKPEKGRYLHPEQHRPITHREAARLQSFPDDFIFVGTKIEIAKQIGNAVPPLLAGRVADVVVRLARDRSDKQWPMSSPLASAAG